MLPDAAKATGRALRRPQFPQLLFSQPSQTILAPFLRLPFAEPGHVQATDIQPSGHTRPLWALLPVLRNVTFFGSVVGKEPGSSIPTTQVSISRVLLRLVGEKE